MMEQDRAEHRRQGGRDVEASGADRRVLLVGVESELEGQIPIGIGGLGDTLLRHGQIGAEVDLQGNRERHVEPAGPPGGDETQPFRRSHDPMPLPFDPLGEE